MTVANKTMCLNFYRSDYNFKDNEGKEVKGFNFIAELYDQDGQAGQAYLKLKVDKNSPHFKERNMEDPSFQDSLKGKNCKVTLNLTVYNGNDQIRVFDIEPL